MSLPAALLPPCPRSPQPCRGLPHRKCELVLPGDVLPNRSQCNDADCPALGRDWDGVTKLPWFKRKQDQERERKEAEKTRLEKRFQVSGARLVAAWGGGVGERRSDRRPVCSLCSNAAEPLYYRWSPSCAI